MTIARFLALLLAATPLAASPALAGAPLVLAQAEGGAPAPGEEGAPAAGQEGAPAAGEDEEGAAGTGEAPDVPAGEAPPSDAPADETSAPDAPAPETPAEEARPEDEGPDAEAPAAFAPAEPPADAPAAPAPDAAVPAAPGAGAPAAPLPGAAPILRDVSVLSEPARRTYDALLAAARSGDIERLRPLIEAQPEPPVFAFDEVEDPIRHLRSLSGDAGGREVLAILLEVLEAGFVHVDQGTPQEMYVWPYFARHPVNELTPEQLVELFTILTAGDYQDMASYGAYIFFRVGIGPDGVWHFFVAGD